MGTTPALPDPDGRLAGLVRALDELRAEPTLTQLADALVAAKLRIDDVAAYVTATPGAYHRASVVRRDHYELLVLTWLPGQGSAPHDHAGSVSAMLVLQGEAKEGTWRIAADGYVDLADETPVREGELTAWQDAGVHTVRNSEGAATPLVSVHVYAPPLRAFRRFAARPASDAAPQPGAPQRPTVVVVGGGFSGSMTAAQLLRQAEAAGTPIRVVLVERQGVVGDGLAYGTRDTAHLLNVPAGRMSAWPDRPDDFVQWASRRHGAVAASDFLPRPWYGEYVRESLLATARGDAGATLEIEFDEVRRLARRPGGGWMVHFARGPSTPADAVVLAIGHRAPPDPIGRLWSGPRTRFVLDPWRAFAGNTAAPDEAVVILGSGLTAVDTVLSLSRQPRRAPIWLVSRRGLVPQTHASAPVAPVDLRPMIEWLLAAPGGLRLDALLRAMLAKLREVRTAGGDWRGVVDGVRPHTATIWGALSLADRRRFLGSVRPYWEVHRHRMAPGVAERFGALVQDGRVRVVAGSVAAAQADDDGVRLYVRERGADRLVELRAGVVINCTGPAASNSAESNPAIGSLLVHGWVRPDVLSLGLETTRDGEVVDAHGEAAADLFVVGTLRKFAVWESTAVPELRVQAAEVGARVVAGLRRGGSTGPMSRS